MEKLIKTIFVPRCSICGEYGVGLCRKCLAKCQVVAAETCVKCDKPSIHGKTHHLCNIQNSPSSLFCAYEYSGIVRNVIRVSKYNQKEFYSLKKLAEFGAVFASKCGISYDNHIVLPIPLSSGRSRERGFNQSEIIAKQLCKEFSLVLNTNSLVRIKNTVIQAKLTKEQRSENLKDAFAVRNQNSILNRNLLLVDDICTTGSTLISAAGVLLREGAAEVNCFTLSKKVI
jgi:ComF family protein